MDTENKGNQLLCSHYEIPELMKAAEVEKARLLLEFKQFYTGDIDIRLHENRHVMGCSLAADLLANGRLVREYDPADLCFLDLNELMLKRLMEARKQETTDSKEGLDMEEKIRFTHNGQDYAMTKDEIEAAYAYQDKLFKLEDAKRNLNNLVFGIDDGSDFDDPQDEEPKAEFEKAYGVSYDKAASKEMLGKYRDRYLDSYYPCSMENEQWRMAIIDALAEYRNGGSK